jgi:hypothetical protein
MSHYKVFYYPILMTCWLFICVHNKKNETITGAYDVLVLVL